MKIKHVLLVALHTWSISSLLAQTTEKVKLDHHAYDEWNAVNQSLISNDGRWVSYVLQPGEGDPILHLYDASSEKTTRFDRANNARFSSDNRFLVFEISAPEDTIRAMKRRKVKKEKLPGDTLAIFDLASGGLEKTPQLHSFEMPEKWPGWLAFTLEPDSVANKKKKGKALTIRRLSDGQDWVYPGIDYYQFAEEGPALVLTSTGADSLLSQGVYHFNCDKGTLQPLFRTKGKYEQLTFDKKGTQLGFLADIDTSDVRVRPFQLFYWKVSLDSVRLVANDASEFIPSNWRLSENGALRFSEDGSRLFLNIAPEPILPDTSLLDDEIVNVEVWSYTDGRLYTQEKVLLEKEKKRSYQVVYHINENKFVQLGDEVTPEIQWGNEGNADIALGSSEQPYHQQISWVGYPVCKDVYLVDLKTGKKNMIAEKVCGNPSLSPEAKYVYWYSYPDSAWFTYVVQQEKLQQISTNSEVPFFDEINDRPMHPRSYGVTGWTTQDEFVIINDRYDLWLIDPLGNMPPNNMTQGRADRRRYRYIRLDPEERSIEEVGKMLLHHFDEESKQEGYVWFNIHTGFDHGLVEGNFAHTRRVRKAKNAERYVFTRENFQTFPDLLYSKDLKGFQPISKANPQQANYIWGTSELVKWTSLTGEELSGILYKPEHFDPEQEYPMMVYFYERSSDRLNRYIRPAPSRSTINFSFYVSRGYLVFVPDIPYRVGYPGESAVNAVIPGVTSLIDKGFVDRERIGVQGHSWGGYQVAYLVTETDLFRCAESGAPVVNMFSAYGGIRWGTGMSRMFQYEQTQSRIGGTIWEYPMRYYENSPLFFTDKINTPLLILHNDEDTAVPWYQGIEFFVALRRLGKPAWLLNYNGEPHGIVKKQNQKDFARRMQQFFDHYLMDAPKPEWMEKGVPPIAKGIDQGFAPTSTDEKK